MSSGRIRQSVDGVAVQFEREMGATVSSISWEFERWATISAMVYYVQSTAATHDHNARTFRDNAPMERRVNDPIDESCRVRNVTVFT